VNYNVILRRVRATIVCSGKTIRITYCECVFVALVIQHEMHMHRIILSSVVCQVLQYFSTLSHKWNDFRGKQN